MGGHRQGRAGGERGTAQGSPERLDVGVEHPSGNSYRLAPEIFVLTAAWVRCRVIVRLRIRRGILPLIGVPLGDLDIRERKASLAEQFAQPWQCALNRFLRAAALHQEADTRRVAVLFYPYLEAAELRWIQPELRHLFLPAHLP